jgi:hypothetical protein
VETRPKGLYKDNHSKENRGFEIYGRIMHENDATYSQLGLLSLLAHQKEVVDSTHSKPSSTTTQPEKSVEFVVACLRGVAVCVLAPVASESFCPIRTTIFM